MISTDIRWAYRSLVRSKGFFATAVVTLGIALGICTTSFAILDGIRHPYTPVQDPEGAFQITVNGALRDLRATFYDRYRMIRDGTNFASDVSLMLWSYSNIRIGDNEFSMSVQAVTPNHLALLGMRPVMGRWFDTTVAPGTEVVISQTAWTSWFPKRSTLGDASITIDEQARRVVGVIPDGVATVLLSVSADHQPTPANRWGQIYVRLRPGVTRDVAHVQLAQIARRLNDELDPVGRGFGFQMMTLAPHPGSVGGGTVILLDVGVLVLVIACANLGGMMLARGIARRRDIALCLALGATRGAIVRQLLAESLVIAMIGCGVGVAVSLWGIAAIVHEIPRQVAFAGTFEPHLNWRIFAFALAVAGAVGVIIGVFPGVRASQVNLDEPLKDSSPNTTGRRQRYSVLVIGQLALAMILLMATGLLVRSAALVSDFDFGFNSTHLVVVDVWTYAFRSAKPKIQPTIEHMLEAASRVPGVKAAAVLSGGVGNFPQQVFPDVPLPDGKGRGALVARATTDFNEVLGLSLVSGRGFLPGDVGTDVAIVDEAAARSLWLGADPIGHSVKVGSWRSKTAWVRVIGVMRDAELGFRPDPDIGHHAVIYLPPAAQTESSMRILARVSGNDATVATAIAREVQTTLGLGRRPTAATFLTASGQESAVSVYRFLAGLMAAFGAFALGLAAIGLYAVMAYAAVQRSREYAVRSALGAVASDLFRLALHDGLVMALAGTAIGAFLAMASAMKLRGILYDLYPVDPLSLVAAEVVLLLVAFLACLGPARRAMRADPAEILRAV